MVHNSVADGASVRTLSRQFISLLWVILSGWRLLRDPLLVELEHTFRQLVKRQSYRCEDFSFDVLRIIGTWSRRLSSLGLESDLLRDGQAWATAVLLDAAWAFLVAPLLGAEVELVILFLSKFLHVVKKSLPQLSRLVYFQLQY